MKKEAYVGEDFVTCLVCQKTLNAFLGTHIKAKHRITSKEYLERYDVDVSWLFSQEFHRRKIKNARAEAKAKLKNDPLYYKKISDAGAKNRNKYFSDPFNRLKNLKKAQKKVRENWANPDFRIKQMKDINSNVNKIISIAKSKRQTTLLWRRKCPQCGKEFSPHIYPDGGSGGVKVFFNKSLFCSKDCLHKAQDGISYREWGKKISELKEVYKPYKIREKTK